MQLQEAFSSHPLERLSAAAEAACNRAKRAVLSRRKRMAPERARRRLPTTCEPPVSLREDFGMSRKGSLRKTMRPRAPAKGAGSAGSARTRRSLGPCALGSHGIDASARGNLEAPDEGGLPCNA